MVAVGAHLMRRRALMIDDRLRRLGMSHDNVGKRISHNTTGGTSSASGSPGTPGKRTLTEALEPRQRKAPESTATHRNATEDVTVQRKISLRSSHEAATPAFATGAGASIPGLVRPADASHARAAVSTRQPSRRPTRPDCQTH